MPSSKSRLPTSFMGNMELLCTECRGIGTHHAASGKSHLFSRVAAGTWGTFSPYSGDGHSTPVCSATSGYLSSYEGNLRNLLEAWQGITDPSRSAARDQGSLSSCHSDIGIPGNFQQ